MSLLIDEVVLKSGAGKSLVEVTNGITGGISYRIYEGEVFVESAVDIIDAMEIYVEL